MWQNQHMVMLLLSEKLVQTLPGPALAFLCRQNRLGSSTGLERLHKTRGSSLKMFIKSNVSRALVFLRFTVPSVYKDRFLYSCCYEYSK